jgi:hypothetical protein
LHSVISAAPPPAPPRATAGPLRHTGALLAPHRPQGPWRLQALAAPLLLPLDLGSLTALGCTACCAAAAARAAALLPAPAAAAPAAAPLLLALLQLLASALSAGLLARGATRRCMAPSRLSMVPLLLPRPRALLIDAVPALGSRLARVRLAHACCASTAAAAGDASRLLLALALLVCLWSLSLTAGAWPGSDAVRIVACAAAASIAAWRRQRRCLLPAAACLGAAGTTACLLLAFFLLTPALAGPRRELLLVVLPLMLLLRALPLSLAAVAR